MSSQSMAPAPTPSGDKPQNLNALFKEVAEEIKAQVNGSKSAQVKEEWRKLFRLWNAGLHALAEALPKWSTASCHKVQEWLQKLPRDSRYLLRLHNAVNVVGTAAYKQYTLHVSSAGEKDAAKGAAMCALLFEVVKFCTDSIRATKEPDQKEQIKKSYRNLLYRMLIAQTASKLKAASELGIAASRALELAVQESESTTTCVRDGLADEPGSGLKALLAAVENTDRSLSCFYLLRILCRLVYDTKTGTVNAETRRYLLDLSKKESSGESQDLLKLLQAGNAGQEAQICTQGLMLLGLRKGSLHRAMPLLTASKKRPDTIGVQEYNGRDLVLLDPYQITLIIANQEGRDCIQRIDYGDVFKLGSTKIQDEAGEALGCIALEIRSSSKRPETVSVICKLSHTNWAPFKRLLVERCQSAYGRSSIPKEPVDLSVLVDCQPEGEPDRAVSERPLDTDQRRSDVEAGIGHSTPSHSADASPSASQNVTESHSKAGRGSSAGSGVGAVVETILTAAEASTEEAPSVRTTRSAAKSLAQTAQASGSQRSSVQAETTTSRTRRKQHPNEDRSSGAIATEDRSAQTITNETQVPAQGPAEDTESLTDPEPEKPIEGPVEAGDAVVAEEARQASPDDAEQELPKASPAKTPRRTYGARARHRPTATPANEPDEEDDNVPEADELPTAKKTTDRRQAAQRIGAAQRKMKGPAPEREKGKGVDVQSRKKGGKTKSQARKSAAKEPAPTEQVIQQDPIEEAEPIPEPSPRRQSLQRDGDEQISARAIENLPVKRKVMPAEVTTPAAKRTKLDQATDAREAIVARDSQPRSSRNSRRVAQTAADAATALTDQEASARKASKTPVKQTRMSASSPGPAAQYAEITHKRAPLALAGVGNATGRQTENERTKVQIRPTGVGLQLSAAKKGRDLASNFGGKRSSAANRFAPYPKQSARALQPEPTTRQTLAIRSERQRVVPKNAQNAPVMTPKPLDQVLQAMHDQVAVARLQQQVVAELEVQKLFAQADTQYGEVAKSSQHLVTFVQKLSNHYRSGERKLLETLRGQDARALKKSIQQARKSISAVTPAQTAPPAGLFGVSF